MKKSNPGTMDKKEFKKIEGTVFAIIRRIVSDSTFNFLDLGRPDVEKIAKFITNKIANAKYDVLNVRTKIDNISRDIVAFLKSDFNDELNNASSKKLMLLQMDIATMLSKLKYLEGDKFE